VNLFSKLLEKAEVEVLGSHSIRKGAITYASTGTPDVLPSHTVSVRSRWKSTGPDGTVHKRYVKFSEAGDQLCGRVLTLLPMQSKEFAILPPHLCTANSEIAAKFERLSIEIFGEVDSIHGKRIIPYLTSSLLFHIDFIKEYVDQSHPIHVSPLFRSIRSEDILRLKEFIVVNSTQLVARGVPASVIVLEELSILKSEMKDIKTHQKVLSSEQEKLTELIPLSAAASGMMCGERQLRELESRLGDHLVQTLTLKNVRGQQLLSDNSSRDHESLDTTFHWDDETARAVPEDFVIMRKGAKLADVWNVWWKGYWVGDKKVMCYRILFQSNVEDMKAVYRKRGQSLETCRRAIREIEEVLHTLQFEMKNNDELTGDYD